MKRVLSLSFLAAANLGLSLLINGYVIVTFGASTVTDAFFAAATLPQLAFAIFSGPLVHILVPLLAGEEEARFRRYASSLLMVISLASLLLVFILGVAAPLWVRLLFPGLPAASIALAITLTRIQLLIIFFQACGAVLTSMAYARMRFVWTETTTLIGSLISFSVIVVLAARWGIVAAAWALVVRAAAPVILLAGQARWGAMEPQLLRTTWKKFKPLLGGTVYFKSDILVDRVLSSMTGPGGLAIYSVAQQIFGSVGQIVNRVVATPLVPALATDMKSGAQESFDRAYRGALIRVSIIAGSLYLAFVALGRLLLDLLTRWGGLEVRDVNRLYVVTVALGGVLVFGSLGQITAGAFYARGDAATPTRLGIVTFTVYVPLKIIAFWSAGLIGLAIATSSFYAANAALQFFALRRIRKVLTNGNAP